MAKQLTGAQKAAILLRAIGEDAAALVMKALDPKDIRKLGSYMKETANITKEEEYSRDRPNSKRPAPPAKCSSREKNT